MVTPHRSRFVLAQVTWLLGAVLVLTALDAFSYGLFALLSVLGFVVVTDVLTPSAVQPRWDEQVRRFVEIGLVVAAAVIAARLLQLFAPELFP